jgi:hypothetical protein
VFSLMMARALVVALLLATAACTGSASATGRNGPLAGGGDNPGEGVGQAITASVELQPYTMGAMTLCTHGKPIVLDKVEVDQTAGSITLDAVGVRQFVPGGTGAEHEGTNAEGPMPVGTGIGPVGGFTVKRSCKDESAGKVTELVMQIHRGKGTATLNGLKITYRVGNQKFVTGYPYTATLCDKTQIDNPQECQRMLPTSKDVPPN